jgi:bifunctional UDP-N-acetylglucosamine pyrophosphorylase/glucosamine-1-phosphate N-acetyltransferase
MAAGKSTRMKSAKVKVLHEICGRPMLAYVLDALRGAGVEKIALVVGHDRERVKEMFGGQGDLTFVEQLDQKGTGHAVLMAEEAMRDVTGPLFVLAGDGPLIRTETLKNLLIFFRTHHVPMILATSELDDPKGYGRILRGPDGRLQRIVEDRDCTDVERNIREVNPSYYLFDSAKLWPFLRKITPNNAKGEYYLTDLVELMLSAGERVEAVAAVPPEDVLSINSRSELAKVSAIMQARIVETVMASGVTITSPANTWIEFGAKIGEDTLLEPFTFIGAGAEVPPGSRVPPGTILPRGKRFGGI